MPAIPHAAKALTSAYDRLEHAGMQLLGAVNGAPGNDNAEAALVDMVFAKAEARANLAVIRFSDEMFGALLDILSKPAD